MSAHSFPKINQKEYLKKYLSGDKVKKKKKDKKNKHKSSSASVKVKIIDDDINNFETGYQIDEDLLLTGDDAPQIVGEYIEENPNDSKVLKWKSIVVKDEPDDEMHSGQNQSDMWGRKAEDVRIKSEFSIGKKPNRSPDNSPKRRKDRQNKSPYSPPRRRQSSPSPPKKYEKSERRVKRGFSPHRKHKTKERLSPPFKKSPLKTQGRKTPFDSSPPRRKKSDHSPRRKSPSRNNTRRSPDQSPSRRIRDLDQPPTRKSKKSEYSPIRSRVSDQSLQRKGRSYSDYSPLRRATSPIRNYTRSSPDQFPTEKAKTNKNKIESPKNFSNRHKRCSDLSPITRDKSPNHSNARRRRDSDQSPPRKGNKSNLQLSSNESPLRKRNSSQQSPPPEKSRFLLQETKRPRIPDQSPPRKRRNSDQSPPRRIRNSPSRSRKRSPDQSPPRRQRKNSSTRVKQEKPSPDVSPTPRRSRWERRESEKSLSPPPTHKPKPGKTLEGKKAGLQDAQALQKETIERRKQEDLLFEKMASEVSGRNAEVQVRSTGRKGRRAREAGEEDPEERRRKEEHEEKKKLLYERWGKGLKQIEDYKNRMLEQEHESSKPLARYSNDEDLERHLKEQERAEDPMLEYMRQKRKEKEKQSDKPQIPRYEGPYPENRFGIRPGYRWDGVDRSNGYEKKYFAVQNEKRARQDEAYKYSVEDM